MSTASKLHDEIIIRDCEAARPVFELWEKISSMNQSRDASLRHQMWLEIFSTRKNAGESYSGLWSRMEGSGKRSTG